MENIQYSWGGIHSKILIETFNDLENCGIRFFVLRNYEGLPEVNESKDVDIIIEPGTFKKAKSLFINVLKKNSISNYYQMDFERAHCCFGIDVNKEFAIHLDFIEGYVNKGYEFVSFDELYTNTDQYKTFRVLNDAYDSCILLMYKVIGCKQLRQKYRDKISRIFCVEPSCKKVLERLLGNDLSADIYNDIIANKFDVLLSKSEKINSVAKKKVFFYNPIKTIKGMWKFYLEKSINMILCPTNKQRLIAVEAPDGTGKTTFIDALRIKISQYFVTDLEKTTVYHFRPTILPNLGAVGEKAGVMKQDINFTDPHRAKPANKVSSFFRLCYYWLDYVIGVPFIVRKGSQFDHFPIFDRFIYDFIVDPARTRLNLPKSIRLFFAHFVKQPQITFVLNADAQTIYKRKQELTLEEIDRQLKVFSALKNEFKNIITLDATQTPDKLATDAVIIIIDKFTQKL